MPVDEFAGLPTLVCPDGKTDVTNGRRLVSLFGDQIRFCHPWGRWLIWDGMRWSIDDDGGALRLAMATTDAIWMEAQEMGDDAARKFATHSASARGCQAMLAMAAAISAVAVIPDQLDQNDWLLNCTNGTLDLRTCELREHRREDNITKLCSVEFDPLAESDDWDQFIHAIFDGDTELISFVQRLLGYSLTGSTREQILPIAHGTGANGKTTLFNTFMETLGPDYAMRAAADLLVAKRQAGHSTERMDLAGKRFVLCSETNDGCRLDEALVKDLTGSERIRGRRMREDNWEYLPTHKIVLATNHKPRVRGTDHGIRRRIKMIPFGVTFADDAQDKELPSRLASAKPAVLAWAVEGCLNWQANGLGAPAAVTAATTGYLAESDLIGRFINEACTVQDGVRVRFSQLSQAIEAWCRDIGERAPSGRKIGQYLVNEGFEPVHSSGRWYLGIGLLESNHGETEA